MKTLIHLLALGCILAGHTLLGQAEDLTAASLGQTYVKHIQHDVAIPSFRIDLNISGASSANWTFCTGNIGACGAGDFQTSIDFGGLTLQGNTPGTAALLTGAPTGEGEFLITVSAEANDGITYRREYLFVIRKPIRMVFVLDKSGSMNGTAPLGSSSKWAMAEDAITSFVGGMNVDTLNLLTEDRISLVAFDADETSPTLLSATFQNISQFLTDAPLVFDPGAGGFSPGGRTSIGDGMAHAVDDLHGGFNDDFRQITILISDGMQNESAMIDVGGKKLTGATGLSLQNTSGLIDTYTIGFSHSDSPGPHEQLLTNIASSSGNYFYTNDLGSYNLTFTEIFAQVFNQSSPQLIDLRRVELASATTPGFPLVEQTFTVNDNAKALLMQVNFNQDIANSLGYRLQKDDVEVEEEFAQLRIGRNSATFSVNFQEHPELGSEGEWTMAFLDIPSDTEENIAAVFTATVDDHSFKGEYEVLNDPTILKVGQPQVNTRLSPKARLSLRGQPMVGALVTARLVEPGADKGTLIASTTADFTANSLNPFAVKFQAIQQQNVTALDVLYEFAEDEIQLVHQGDGLYTGRFGQLNVADNVSVIFRVIYQDSLIGTIQRYHRSSIPVRFGELDHNLGAISASSNADNIYTITYKPQYFNGAQLQLVGPGYGSVLRAENGNMLNVEDQGDGTYILTMVEDDPNTGVNLFLLDEPIYSGPLKDFAKQTEKPYDLSLHLGYAFPLAANGLLDSVGNGGLLAELDFGYRFSQRWSLELIGGYYDYQPNNYLLGGGPHLRYHVRNPGQRFNWTAAVGFGYYARDVGSGVTGFGLRLGGEYHLSQSIRVMAEIGGYSIDQVSDMGLAAVGLRYRF